MIVLTFSIVAYPLWECILFSVGSVLFFFEVYFSFYCFYYGFFFIFFCSGGGQRGGGTCGSILYLSQLNMVRVTNKMLQTFKTKIICLVEIAIMNWLLARLCSNQCGPRSDCSIMEQSDLGPKCLHAIYNIGAVKGKNCTWHHQQTQICRL